jgi:hypothetical protein
MGHSIRLRGLNSLDFIENKQSKRSHRGQRGMEIFVSSCTYLILTHFSVLPQRCQIQQFGCIQIESAIAVSLMPEQCQNANLIYFS